MRRFIFFFCLVSAFSLPLAEATEPQTKAVRLNMGFSYGGLFSKIPTVDIRTNGINMRFKGESVNKRGTTVYWGSIPFIQSQNTIIVRSDVVVPNDFVIKQGGRDVCRLKLKPGIGKQCNFEASDKPNFKLEDTIQELNGTFKAMSTETAFAIAEKHFTGPHHMTVRTGVFRSKIEDGKRTYHVDGLKSARFSNLPHLPRSMAIDPSSGDGFFVLFRPGETDLEPLVKGTDIFGFTFSDDVFGVTIMRVSGADYIVAELTRRGVKRVLAF